ncbi:MAG: putative DNA binding domain-containing protein [SAR324 cluster bacterium]|nr:putative DNA binding domain-containing protein [SAR324 cluster bacterium]
MNLTEKDLQDLLIQGENSSIEFKSADTRPENIAKEMVALSNVWGGTILLGVRDDGAIEGIPEDFRAEEWIANIARNNVIPPILPRVQCLHFKGKTVCVVHIERGKEKPYQANDFKYYVRVGSTNRIATQPELLRLFQASGMFHYDSMPVARTTWNDLNLSKVDHFFKRYEFEFSGQTESEQQTLLINSDIQTDSGELTVAGLLMFGINPARYLPQCGIMFAHFAGEDLTDTLIDRKPIQGTLDDQVDTCLAAIKNNFLTPSTIQGTKRMESPPIYEDKIFRELLTNACVHRNYSISGSMIRVFLFQNRIEFISPGRLPNTINIEKLKVGVSYAINPVILKFMDNLRYIDRLGRGLPMVYRASMQRGMPVEFKEIGEEFHVILPL